MLGVGWRFVAVGCVAMACDGPARPPEVAAAEVARPEVARPEVAASEAAELRLTGVLRYTELPRTKSVEAYMGREFTLVTGEEALNLKASAAVPAERLRALDGATITVRARFHPAAGPDPRESAPMGADGAAMMRPAYHEVLEVVSAPAGP